MVRGPDTRRRARSILQPLRDNAKVDTPTCRRAFVSVADCHGAQSRDLALGTDELLVAADNGAAGGDEASQGCGELLERCVDRGRSDVGDRVRPHHPGLKLGDLRQRAVDGILDGTDLGCDFESGSLNHLFAHDGSFPDAWRRSDCRADLKVGLLLAP